MIFGCYGKNLYIYPSVYSEWILCPYLLTSFFTNRITRYEDHHCSNIKIFSTQFYTKLENEGIESVKTWTRNKNVDVFKKKFLIIPINKTNHWLLAVIVNPGHLPSSYSKGFGKPFLILLDSHPFLDYEVITRNVYSWLNAEAERLKRIQNIGGLNEENLPILTPDG